MSRITLLAITVAILCMTAASGTLQAQVIFSEEFDSDLWNVLYPHFSPFEGVLRGNGDGDRGAMFRSAAGIQDLQFTFQHVENSDSRNSGDTVQIAITPNETVDTTFRTIAGSRVEFFADARQSASGGEATFSVYDGNQRISNWNIESQIGGGLYDGLIRLNEDDTVTFGYRPFGGDDFNLSPAFSLPQSFAGSHVGIAAFRVPPGEGASGVATLDNVAASGTLQAQVIFSEEFDSDLWNVLYPHFSPFEGVLRGNGDGDRGAMFRSAAGIQDLQFTFQHVENSDSRNSGDTVQIAITPNETVDTTFRTIAGSRVEFFADARQSASGGEATFSVYDGNQRISNWNIESQIGGGLYDGLIRLNEDDTVTFGYRPFGGDDFNLSPAFSLPQSFAGSHVGIAAFRVPPGEGASGVATLDNVAASVISPGDYDKNGSVDSADYDVWKSNFGSSFADADGNRNGIVDAADYTIWRDNVGAGNGSFTSVPEPRTEWLILAAVFAMVQCCNLRMR